MDCEKTCIERTRRGLSTTLKDRARKSVGEFRTVVRALGRPDVPWYARLTCGLAMLYVVSPIQLIPNFIPVLGQMDDVLVLGLAMGVLRRSAPPAAFEECQDGPRQSRSSVESVNDNALIIEGQQS